MINVGFYGTGNMALAMAKGMKGLAKVYGFGKNPKKNKAFSKFGKLCKSENELFEKVDVVILGVKPQNFDQIVKIPKPCCSLLAGVEISRLQKNCSSKILRIMPSLSIENRKGAILKCGDQIKGLDSLLNKLGKVFLIQEENFHELSLIAGSMPALIAIYLQSIQNSISVSLSDKAKFDLVSSAFNGVTITENFSDLITRVASPGGITQAYLSIADQLQLLTQTGLNSAKLRSKELSA